MAKRQHSDTKPKGTELIYATRQNSSFSSVSFQRRNQYIEVGALEMFLDTTVPMQMTKTGRWSLMGTTETDKM